MARRIEDFELDPAIIPIEDGVDTSPAAVRAWFAGLKADGPVTLTVSAAEIIREIREFGEE